MFSYIILFDGQFNFMLPQTPELFYHLKKRFVAIVELPLCPLSAIFVEDDNPPLPASGALTLRISSTGNTI
jgi:hypothetical protein